MGKVARGTFAFCLVFVILGGLIWPCGLLLAAGTPAISTPPGQNPLGVEVWTDRGEGGVYAEGESMTLYFRVSRDAYVMLFDVNAEGQVKLVFPNPWDKETAVRRGWLYAVPRGGYEFIASAPFGRESVVALVTSSPLDPALVKGIDTVKDGQELVARLGEILSSIGDVRWAVAQTGVSVVQRSVSAM